MKAFRLFHSGFSAQMATMAKPVRLVLDWDGTMTRKDTMSVIGSIPLRRDERLGIHAAPEEPEWTSIGKAYMDDYNHHVQNYTPSKEARTTKRQESDWLRSLKVVEQASAARVSELGVFRRVTSQDVATTARQALANGELQLRPGCLEFLKRYSAQSGSEVHNVHSDSTVEVLSVNWSAQFVREALLASTDEPDMLQTIADLPLVANEIHALDDPKGSDGILSNGGEAVQTSADKLARLFPAKDQPAAPSMNTVYVGDSATDFDCLIAADVGICIRDEPMGSGQQGLAETLDRLGIEQVHVGEVRRLDGGYQGLWWARNLEEVLSFIDRWRRLS